MFESLPTHSADANPPCSPRHGRESGHPRLSCNTHWRINKPRLSTAARTLSLLASLTLPTTAYATGTLCDQLNYLANQTGPMLANVPHAPLRPPPPDPNPNAVADPWDYGKSSFTFGGGYACTFRQLGTTALVHLECDLSPGAAGITGNVDACMSKFSNWQPLSEGQVTDQIFGYVFSRADLSESLTIWSRPDGVLTFIDISAHNP